MPYQWNYWTNLALSRTHLFLDGDASMKGPALEAGRRAVAADPNDPTPHARLAEIAGVLGEYDEGLDQAVAAIVIFQGDFSYDHWAAANAIHASDQRAALAQLERALSLHEGFELHLGLAQVLLNLGDLDGARVHARRALELHPADSDALRILADVGG
jgi:tetratricopeptide (TPR) repeat protein